MIICALVPLACGKVRLSCSMPACDSVPGIEKELSVPCPSVTAPAPAMPSRSSHEISTRHGWRYDQRPREYSNVDTTPPE